MTGLKNGIWVVVADGEKALILVNDGDAEYPVLRVADVEKQENPPNREQSTDAPGRYNDGPTVMRSAVSETDWHRLAKDRFAKELSDILYKHAHRGDFREIVLVGSPHVLGELRKDLHSEVTDRAVAWIDKTLTNHPVDEIEKIVAGEMAEHPQGT